MDIKRPLVVEFTRVYHDDDALTGIDGHPTTENNPPEYLVGDIAEVLPIHTRYCCEAMKEQFQKGTIGFGARKEEVYRNKLESIFVRVASGSKNDIDLPYCPWCREPVMTHEVTDVRFSG